MEEGFSEKGDTFLKIEDISNIQKIENLAENHFKSTSCCCRMYVSMQDLENARWLFLNLHAYKPHVPANGVSQCHISSVSLLFFTF